MFGHKKRTYLNYAIGELILVVVGILIALQINNWNEERIEQRQIKEYARGLIQDLKRDVVMSETIRADINLILQRIEALSAHVRGKSVDELRNIDLFYLMREPFYRPYTWNRTSFEQIESSGALRQIRNRQLAERISAYAAFTHHLDGDFEFDRTIGTKAIELAIKIVDMNYPDVNALLPVGERESFSFPNSRIHDAYRDTNLSLLTDDINDVRTAVDAYLTLGGRFGIRPRAEIEMPALIAHAQELIDLLESEYSE